MKRSAEAEAGTGKPQDYRVTKEYAQAADELLVEATQFARQIERPIWRNQALERTAISAGESAPMSNPSGA